MRKKDEVRRDPKGRKLRTGETYDEKTQRYRYSYPDANGVRRQIYSWTLTSNDTVPSGKRQKSGQSLREKEDMVNADILNAIDTSGGNMTVYSLLEKYVKINAPKVRETTKKGYRTQMKFMATNSTAQIIAKKKICKVTAMEAEEWMQELHEKEGRSYSSLHTLKGMLRQAFILAKKSRWVHDNPFDFSLSKKAYGGTKTRDALSREDMRRFLDFVRTDKHFSRYFDGIYLLFHTGLRVSEMVALTPEDIDFDEHVIRINKQLLRVYDGKTNKYILEEPKSKNGYRFVPMTKGVEEAFRNVMKNRPEIEETVIWDELHQNSATGFLWVDKDGNYEVAQHWQNHLRWAVKKHNRLFKNELPPISPHVCRHTFCTNCAVAGVSPVTLKTIMGHSSIEFSLNVYTHIEGGDVKKNFFTFMNSDNYDIYEYKRVPDIVTPNVELDVEEGEVDFNESPDDDYDE